MSVRRLAVTAAALGVLTLSGCSGESTSAEPEPSPSAASPSPSSTEPALAQEVMAQPPQRPEDEKTVAGAKAFAAYVMKAMFYGTQQRDFSLLKSLQQEKGSCQTCLNTEESVEAGAQEGRRQLATEPVKILSSTLLDKNAWIVGVQVRFPKVVELKDGEQVNTIAAENEYIEMGLEWHGGKWTLFNYRFAED